ncbi:MAG: COX15/CtaA family protein [Bacteroidota bacterium]
MHRQTALLGNTRSMNRGADRWIIRWLFSGCILIYLMVLIGGLTRLTNSGLSMVEWSPTGSLPPLNEADWQEQFSKYKQSPEFRLINYDFNLSDFKKIFWWEYIHRFLGRTIGLVFAVPFFLFWMQGRFKQGFLKKVMVLILLGALQGLIGWYMVKSGLNKDPHVSHYRLALHLVTALILFGFTFWYALDLLYPAREQISNQRLKNLTILFLGLVLLQIIYGAFVAGLKAGYLYPTFPKMGANWVPEDIAILRPGWKNLFEGPACVQFIHRSIAYILVFATTAIYLLSRKANLTVLQRKLSGGLVLAVLLQFVLGVITLIYQVPIVMAVLHQTGAFILLGITLYLIHRLR